MRFPFLGPAPFTGRDHGPWSMHQHGYQQWREQVGDKATFRYTTFVILNADRPTSNPPNDQQMVIYEHSTARAKDPAKKFRDLRQASPSLAKREMGKAHWARLVGQYFEYETRRQNDTATSISHQLWPYQALLEREALSQGLLDGEVTALDGAVRRLDLGSDNLAAAPPPYEGPAVQHAHRRTDYRSTGSIARMDTSDGESLMTLSDCESFYDADEDWPA